jgi:iron complex transport system permease protein
MPTRRRALLILAALAGLSQLSIVLALMVGSIPISPAEVLASLLGDASGMTGDVVRSLRLPRALTGFACGGLLALAGALLQVLLRNPLAQALGVAVRPLRRGVYLVASLATAAAVTHAGAIGFIGLIVPHLVRLATGNDQRLLLPASVLAGGSLLVIADTLARTILAPQQLPVGVLTALIGVPVFLFLLTRGAAGRG